MQTQTREEWLQNITIKYISNHFENCGYPTLKRVIEAGVFDIQFSVSFMANSRSGSKKLTIGQYLNPNFNKDGGFKSNILIHPRLNDSIQVVGTLIHELIHYEFPQDGHGKNFRKMALAVGLEGKMTATTVSEDLTKRIKKWILYNGEYPHQSFDQNTYERKKQSTRMIKVQCLDSNEICGEGRYKVRMSRTLIEQFGEPICPCCQNQMVAQDF